MTSNKVYVVAPVINKEDCRKRTFRTRDEANSYVGKLLDKYHLNVDHIIKRNRKHNVEFVCDDYRSRFFVNRVLK